MMWMKEKGGARPFRKRRAISPVISTLIISASVLIATSMASFMALNILELQSQQTEFDQGRFNMQTLAEIIEDTGVKPGSGSFIRFNERTGGLGYTIDDSRSLKITVNDGTPITLTPATLNVTYRAGRLVSTYDQTVKGKDNLIISGLASSMGLLRQRQLNGASLTLDFNRVRIVSGTKISVGSDQYQLVTVTFFNVTHGTFSGSGNLDVKIQNMGPPKSTQIIAYGSAAITVYYSGVSESFPTITQDPDSKGIIVMVNVSDLELSTL